MFRTVTSLRERERERKKIHRDLFLLVHSGLRRGRGRERRRELSLDHPVENDEQQHDDHHNDHHHHDHHGQTRGYAELRLSRFESVRGWWDRSAVQRVPIKKRLSPDVGAQRSQVADSGHSRKRQRNQEQHAAI